MNLQAPTKPYVFASIAALLTGVSAYGIGLLNATMALNEKGYYLCVILYGLFSVVSLQKTIRDKAEGIPTSAPAEHQVMAAEKVPKFRMFLPVDVAEPDPDTVPVDSFVQLPEVVMQQVAHKDKFPSLLIFPLKD